MNQHTWRSVFHRHRPTRGRGMREANADQRQRLHIWDCQFSFAKLAFEFRPEFNKKTAPSARSFHAVVDVVGVVLFVVWLILNQQLILAVWSEFFDTWRRVKRTFDVKFNQLWL